MASFGTQKACTSLASSSSSSMSQWKYEVFLSFYGEDTRKNFTDHLYATLIRKSIYVYRDNENLEQGKPIASGLMKAIEESKYAIIVLSKNYALSKWCLNELVKILECKEKGLKVWPIFYHVNPSDVGNQRETFEQAFLEHEKDPKVSMEQIDKWRAALKEVSKIRGRHLVDSPESVDIEEITKSIFDELNCELPEDSEHLVGIDSHVKEMMNLFSTMSDDVRFIGIWGMPGIGKTTLARAIYIRIRRQFEASSFISDIREKDEKYGRERLQKQLLLETLGVTEDIMDPCIGINVIKKRLQKKEVLIVLDDVDKDEQLEALAGKPDWFGLGSMIIITSKDKHLLKRHHLGTTINKARGLDNDEALELFSWYAFKQTYPKKDFEDLSNGFVKYAKGLPIALKVLGSSLIDRPREVWEDHLHQLEEILEGETLEGEIPEGKILDKLEISYKGLAGAEKDLFLDIACFFKGEDKNRVAHIEGSGCKKNIETLKDKSLIAILGGKLHMHDLIQQMGWRIVSRESPQERGRRSRLWLCKDVFHVLKKNTGTEIVKGIVLDFRGKEVRRKENLNDKAFSNMESLRLLKISNVHLPKGLDFLSNELRMMEWHDYPLKSMPVDFQPDNLVEFIMPRSHIEQLPEGLTNLAKLRLLDLSDSKVLVKTPNFIGCPNLERLIFQGCTSLYELHPSIGALNKLTLLNLKDCRSLASLPCEINLKSLEIFILSGCSNLKKFSGIGTNMTSLSELYLDGTAVEELPSSLERLTGLTVLSLQDCKNLSSLPASVNLPSLQTLNLSGINQPPKSWLSHGFSLVRAVHAFFKGFFPIREVSNLLLPRLRFIVSLNLSDRNLWDGGLPDDLSCLSSLQTLDLSKNNFTRLPDSISQLSKLKTLLLNDCSRLQSLPDLPSSVGIVGARRCPLLEKYSNQDVPWTSSETGCAMIVCNDQSSYPLPSLPFFERLVDYQNRIFWQLLSSTETPEWFIHQSLGSSLAIPLPSNLSGDRNWIGIALFTSVVILENLNDVSSGQDDEFSVDFICRSDIIEGLCINFPVEFNVSKHLPILSDHASSFGLKVFIPAGKLRDHLEDCSCIRAFIRSKCTYIKIETCGARVLYEQDLLKFLEAEASVEMEQGSECDLDKVESNQSNDRLKAKLMPLLLRVYQGDLARNHKYDYVFPHMTVPDWFSNRNFCSDIRIRLPTNLQHDGRWMGIAVCAYYTVQERLAISGDNKDLTSFLNFYNPSVSHRVCLTRHRVFQESKDIFVESAHRILVFYIPQVLLRLEECRHIGVSFEHDKPDVRVKECGLRLVYEQDVENFVQTLAQCMSESPDAYHECFYQNLLHQVQEREASKDFGFSSSLQRMPQSMPVLQPSNENIAEGCTFSATSPSSFTGFLATARKEQYASIMSSESLIKARLEKAFDEGEIFNCCFAEREIPQWFGYKDTSQITIELSPELVNDPDWMGFALCGLFSFNMNPTAVRQSLSSKKNGMLPFNCHLRTSSSNWRLVCPGILTMENELVTLNQRSFIWVMFIPRNTHAHLWSQSAWVDFELESAMPHLCAHSSGINVVYRHSMEELTHILVQCSAPFDSFIDSCDPQRFCPLWDNYPELFIGIKNSYEYLHPQRLFISQEETSVTAQFSYEEDSYPHNRFRYFHPSTLYNSCFPTTRTPRWFNHHCRLGHSVTIEIPPNLYEDNNWLGLSLYASIFIPRGQENAVPANSSHFLYCQFQTSKASLDNQILVCRTTDEEDHWLHQVFGRIIWISYIPGEALKDMLHQCGHIKASFVSDWPSVMVQKCGLRLLYQHDLSQFEQQLKHCNASISACRYCKCECSRSGSIPTILSTPSCNEVVSPLNNYGGHFEYSFCFPPVEILHRFDYQSNEPSVKIDISNYSFNDNKWMGLVLFAYFSSDKHQTAIIENPNSSISHHLICVLETDRAAREPEIHVHRTIEKEFTWLDIEGGFLWLCYIPCCPFLDEFSCIKASIISDWPGIIVQKCGLTFYHMGMGDNWFEKIIDQIMEELHKFELNDQFTARYKVKISRDKNQPSQSHLPGFDGSCDYNSCCIPIEIPHWFCIQNDKSHVTFELTQRLHNRSTWLGVALCANFIVTKDVASLIDIMDSISSYKLICHLEASNGSNDLSVKPRHIYWPTKEELMISLLGGLTWLTYIPRGSFPDWLYDCDYIKVSFETNCSYLKVQNCGLRLLYQDSVEEFKNCVKNCMKSDSDFLGIPDQKKTENINKEMRSWIQNELGKNDPLGFDRCIFNNPHLHPSEILEWFSELSDVPWVRIDLTPTLYNESSWMGLVLCAYFAIDVKTIAHFDIPDSDTPYELIYHLETNVGSVIPIDGHRLTKEDLLMLQQGGCILLSYKGRGSFQNCLNQVHCISCIQALFTTNCPGLKVEKCGLRLLYHYELEEFEQTISHSMNNSSSDDWDLIHQLPTEDGNRDTQKHDYGEGTSSSRKESNSGSLRRPIDPKDKGKQVL